MKTNKYEVLRELELALGDSVSKMTVNVVLFAADDLMEQRTSLYQEYQRLSATALREAAGVKANHGVHSNWIESTASGIAVLIAKCESAAQHLKALEHIVKSDLPEADLFYFIGLFQIGLEN